MAELFLLSCINVLNTTGLEIIAQEGLRCVIIVIESDEGRRKKVSVGESVEP